MLIGAGSAIFTQGLVADLIQAESSHSWELGLVDIDSEALENITLLARKMIDAAGVNIRVSGSENRRDILPGADIVVTTIAVGGRRAWEADVFIPRKYGVYQPVGDTVMPGGISRAMRMIPVMLDIARDVAELCPNAYFFNYSNPMTAICRAVRKATRVPVIGLCHGVNHIEGYLASFAGLLRNRVSCIGVGVNHLTYIIDFRYEGKNAWPLIDKELAQGKTEVNDNPFAWSIYNAYGAYPAVNDRHIVEFYPEFFAGGEYYGKRLGIDAFSFEDTIKHGDETYAEMVEQALGQRPLRKDLFHRAEGEHEQLLEILISLYGDKRKVFSVNLPNEGAVPNLPQEAVLEMPAVATGRGFCQLHINDFPDVLAAKITRHLAAIEVTVDAALSGNRKLLVEALLADGSVTDRHVAGKLADELLQAHAPYLPQFE